MNVNIFIYMKVLDNRENLLCSGPTQNQGNGLVSEKHIGQFVLRLVTVSIKCKMKFYTINQ